MRAKAWRMLTKKQTTPVMDRRFLVGSCWVPCDHIPSRSWPLFQARDVLQSLITSLKDRS